jgi:TonB-linked SusC/RagA family outer membrane protein
MHKKHLSKKYWKVFLLCAVLLGTMPTILQAAPTSTTVVQQDNKVTVQGTLKDASGEPIVGASVLEVGTSNGTVTDLNGHYSLSVRPGAKINVSYVGFVPQTIIAKAGISNITLHETQQSLNEVVVVGYGTQKKVDLTGSVAAISEKDLQARPITSVSAGIQGLAPGVTVLNESGKPGADGGSFQIRGKGTLNNSNPYILVDGVETGTIDAIDPSDIESISVLKDAASSAIYGSKAANGVILITTKRGKEGRTSVNYNGSVGFQNPTYLLEKMHSYDYARMYNKALTDAGKSPRFTDEEIEKFRDNSDPYNYPDTRWYDLAFQTGILTKHNVNITGGGDRVRYMVSGGYLYQKGTLRNSDRDQFNMRSNIDMKVSRDVTMHANMAYIHNNYSQPI